LTLRTREFDAFSPILTRAKLPRDGALVVHSAIASLTRARFRAEAMIEAFVDHVRDGTLLMPTMTWRTVTVDNPDWDELATTSHTGVMSEIFRTRCAEARSIHPTHSVAARGRDAAALLSQHHLVDTPVSAKSPYGLLRDRETFILMIGVGLESVTVIHLPEELNAPDVYLRPQIETYRCRDRHGHVYEVRTRRHWRLDRDFPKFGPPLRKSGELEVGTIEGCPYQIVSMRALLRDVFRAFENSPHGTLREGDPNAA
jgi:aminoglycoside 3-N-acetyltransferase